MRRCVALALAAALAGCGTEVDLGGSGARVDASQCGDLVEPNTDAECRACNKDAGDCQPNGCYGGYWCNVVTIDCHKPPETCP